MSDSPPWLNSAEARELLGVSKQRLAQLVKDGRIKTRAINARRRLYSRSSLEQFKADRTAPTQRRRRRQRKRKPNRAAAMLAAMRRPLAHVVELPARLGAGENRWIDRPEWRGWVQCAADTPGAVPLSASTWVREASKKL